MRFLKSLLENYLKITELTPTDIEENKAFICQ